MFLKNSCIHENTTHIQHQEFHERVKSYKKLVLKTCIEHLKSQISNTSGK